MNKSADRLLWSMMALVVAGFLQVLNFGELAPLYERATISQTETAIADRFKTLRPHGPQATAEQRLEDAENTRLAEKLAADSKVITRATAATTRLMYALGVASFVLSIIGIVGIFSVVVKLRRPQGQAPAV